MSKFKYRERSAETVKARAEQSTGDYDSCVSGPLWKISEGRHNIRILPPTWDLDSKWGDNWAIETWVHRNIGPDKATYLCLNKMRDIDKNCPDEDCPICAARGDMEEEQAKELAPKKQMLAYIIDRDDERGGPQVWRLGVKIEKEIQIRSQDSRGALIHIDEPNDGFDVRFRREGKGLNTEYNGVDIDRDPSPIAEKQAKQDDVLDYLMEHPLPSLLHYYDADYMQSVFMGRGGSRRKDDGDGERGGRRGAARSEDREEPDTRRSRDREEPEEEDRRSSRDRDRGRREEPEEDFETEEPEPETRNRRRPSREEPEEEAEAEEPEDTAARGRQSLERLKGRTQGSGRARESVRNNR